MDQDNEVHQTIRLDIHDARPSYTVSNGLKEAYRLMVRATPTRDIPGLPAMWFFVEIGGHRELELVADGPDPVSPPVGVVQVTTEGCVAQTIMPLDMAWRIGDAISSEIIGTAIVHCDQIREMGDRVVMHRLEFLAG